MELLITSGAVQAPGYEHTISCGLEKTPNHSQSGSEASPFPVLGFPSDGNQNACGKGADSDHFCSDSGRLPQQHPKSASRQEEEGAQNTQGLEVLFDFQNQERRMTDWCRGKILPIETSLL